MRGGRFRTPRGEVPSLDDFVPTERRGLAHYLLQRRGVFLVAYMGYAACYLVRNNIKVSSDALVVWLQFSAADIGTILACFSVAYGVGKAAMGILVDHVSIRALFSWALGIAAILCILLTWASSVAMFAVVAITAGLVQSACAPAALALIGSWYPNRSRGSRVALWNTSQNVGAALLPLFVAGGLGLLGPASWRVAFWAPGLVVLAVAIWTYHAGGDRPWREGLPTLTQMFGRAGVPDVGAHERHSYWQAAWRHVFRSRSILLLAAVNALLYFERFGIINWLKVYLVRDQGMGTIAANLVFSVLELGAVLGAAAFAILAWQFPNRMATVGAFTMPLLGCAVLLYANASSQSTTVLAAGAIGMFVYGPQVIVNILTLNLVPPRVLGIAIGVVSLPSYLLGEVGANIVQPLLARTAGWEAAHIAVAGSTLLAAVLYWQLRSAENAAVVVQDSEP